MNWSLFFKDLGVKLELRRLRRRMFSKPPLTAGLEKCGSYMIRITDGPNFYIQFKDLFVKQIYHFYAVRPDPLIIDGGSNMGMSILYFKQLYPQSRIIGFEPDPDIFSLLQENTERNRLEGVTLINSGLSAVQATKDFSSDGSASGHLVADRGAIRVRVERLSDYLDEAVDFLKLNIEGEELAVLEETAASGKLKNVRELVLEYHGWANCEQKLGPLLSLLDSQRFRYLLHDFDHETCGTSKPPFRLMEDTNWFCLVYGRNLDSYSSLQGERSMG